jgi:diguanylate cyclase (GGDEF)-like protein
VLLVAAILPLAIRLEDHIAGIGMIMSILFAAGMTFVFARLAREQQAMLENFATQDALTSLGNRRLMDVEIRRCIDDFKRTQLPATIIVIDLDNFKLINDQFGHSVGDDLLVKIADLLRSRVRKTDRLFRFGGEEFVVLARNTSLAAAKIIAEDLRKHIALHISSPSGSVTASFGCAELNPNDDANQWFARADHAMYCAKEQGRNRVALAA